MVRNQAKNSDTIGGLAKAAGVGVETVRYYQRRGLLPEPARAPGRGGPATGEYHIPAGFRFHPLPPRREALPLERDLASLLGTGAGSGTTVPPKRRETLLETRGLKRSHVKIRRDSKQASRKPLSRAWRIA